MKSTGKFIAFEGIDGSGKSTQMLLLKHKLEEEGYPVYCTFEPSDNMIGSLIRSIIKGEQHADNRTIAALFAADRLHHLLNEQDGILKKLHEGYIVLCDRFYFSSYAYHSVHMDMEWVIEINEKSVEIIRPDLNLFLDVTPEMAMNRIERSRNKTDLYETLDMLKNVYHNYQIAFEKMKDVEKIVTIDGNAGTEVIAADIRVAVQKII